MATQKRFRQGQILKLITSDAISSQDELRRRLAHIKLRVTQATLSRDIAELKLVGIYDSLFHDDVLFFRLDYLFDLLPERRRNKVFAFHMLIDNPNSMPRICKEIDEIFRNSTARTRTEAERAFELGFVSMLGNVKAFLLSISLALTFTLLLVTPTRWRCPCASGSARWAF